MATNKNKNLPKGNVANREFFFITIDGGNRKKFTVFSGGTKKRIYQTTVQYPILSAYYDGVNAVIQCEKMTYIYGPSNINQPEKGWRRIREMKTN